jgi:hypothetical protein
MNLFGGSDMERKAHSKKALVCILIMLFLLPASLSAQGQGGRRGGMYGDWRIQVTFGDREMESILSFSRNQEGQVAGQWISFWGMNDLQEVVFADNKLSFTQSTRFGDQEWTSKFTGTVEEGKLSGTLSGDRGDSEVKGQREPRPARGVGSWDMTIKAGEREMTGLLTISADPEGNLQGSWTSERGSGEITDVKYENRQLTFKRTIQRDSGSREMTFTGTIGPDSLEGVFKSDRGEAAATGKQVGAALIGTWDLDISSERGERKQRLRVDPDLSALYGSTRIDKIEFNGDNVRFTYSLTFGDNTFETSFTGKIVADKLTGELTSSRGTQKVAGTKRPPRGRRPAP